MSKRRRAARSLDVAIAHDQWTTSGGAERVAREMARLFDAPVYAMAVDEDHVPDDLEVVEVSGPLGTLAMSRHHLIEDLYQWFAWQHVPELYEHDVIIQNKTNPMWFVPRDDQTVVRYLHSTPRGMYDRFESQGSGLLSRILKFPQRPLFMPNVRMADAWAVNSDVVRRRARLYWNVEDPEVVYPPVPVGRFGDEIAPTRGYYVTLSRLRGHKRIHHAIKAANRAGADLKVIGDGPERDRLERLAGPTVDLLGYVDEAEKAALLSGAGAMLMTAENEDFGIAPIEAMASGTPVIGADEGFTRKQVVDGANGLLYDGTPGGLGAAMASFERRGVDWSPARIEKFADRFSADRFRRKMLRVVDRAVESSRVEVPWEHARRVEEGERGADAVAADGGD